MLVVKRHGFDKHFVKLNGKGNGQVIVPFGRKKVKAVYVSLVNASTRFKCGKQLRRSPAGPADRRRAQLRGQALQVQRRGHQARLSITTRDLRPLAVAAATAVVSVGLLALAVARGWLGPDVGRGSGFCERTRTASRLLVQPANSLSNLGFVVAGLAVAWYAGRTDLLGDVLPRLRGLPTAYAVVTVLLGSGERRDARDGSERGGGLDLLSMYLIASFAAAYALMRLVRQGVDFFFQVFLLLVAACELVGTIDADVPVVHDSGNLAFGTAARGGDGDGDRCCGGAPPANRAAPAPTCGGGRVRSRRWSWPS